MENGEGAYAQDGSVDLRGNPVLRSKRGGWTACAFIVGARRQIVVCIVYVLFTGSLVAFMPSSSSAAALSVQCTSCSRGWPTTGSRRTW